MYILGISGALGHDASACLINDGKIVAMAEEERFIRRKKAFMVKCPINAPAYCLHEAGITMSDVDYLAIGWTPELRPDLPIHSNIVNHDIFRNHRKPQIRAVDHHLAHAASAYYCSGFDEAAILIIDGQAEDDLSTTMAFGKGPNITPLKAFGVSQSLGLFYTALTTYLGFSVGQEGKLMGLAPYGTSRYDFSLIHPTDDGYRIDISTSVSQHHKEKLVDVRAQWNAWLETNFGAPNYPGFSYHHINSEVHPTSEFSQAHKDLAASCQATLESIITHLVRLLVKETNCRNLVISGGVGLNCAANGKLLDSDVIDQLYIFPASNDAGTSLGAALATYYALHPSDYASDHSREIPYLGPSYSNEDIEETLTRFQIHGSYFDAIESKAAELICDGKIIGWFQGRMEIGPRALGNRSILASPLNPDMHTKVNNIKGRELWRPLAPSMLFESAGEYIENAQSTPFMLTAHEVFDDKKEIIPAVVHVDGTTRPQTVTKSTNLRYWNLIRHVGDLTSIPIVLNTSFNLRGEPIVCNPVDAIRTFFSCKLDALVMGNYLIAKNP